MSLSPEVIAQLKLAQAEAERRRLADQSVPVLFRTAKDLLAEGETEAAEALAAMAEKIVKDNLAKMNPNLQASTGTDGKNEPAQG